ncbi:hypothetical protein K7I13_01120 [Brucepastera parasyntrophica]|uniref:hypothetical protein n=1 Tax=Brucepastera parasyntrophica TaxID=2880008 RepID=UPI00210CAEF0|nr:hypothetical protein [Brucepastera parasyntrophica]ULQ59973.1 hypothetical protein K7I13_01120 [Brucepastera parasyntrophica]
MKRGKKAFISIIFLIIVGAVVFFIGWIQFAVPAGHYGVMISKTGGVNPKPVLPAEFRWQWERLLPTNTTLIIFDPAPVNKVITTSDTLPLAETYSKLLNDHTDFSWKIVLDITAGVKPEILPELVEKNSIKTQDQFEDWLAKNISTAADSVSRQFIGSVFSDYDTYMSSVLDPTSRADSIAQNSSAVNSMLELVSLSVKEAVIPDFSQYSIASETYTTYQKARSEQLAEIAAKESANSVYDYLQIERLAQWGELISKYPSLIELLAVAKDDSAAALQTIKSLR